MYLIAGVDRSLNVVCVIYAPPHVVNNVHNALLRMTIYRRVHVRKMGRKEKLLFLSSLLKSTANFFKLGLEIHGIIMRKSIKLSRYSLVNLIASILQSKSGKAYLCSNFESKSFSLYTLLKRKLRTWELLISDSNPAVEIADVYANLIRKCIKNDFIMQGRKFINQLIKMRKIHWI